MKGRVRELVLQAKAGDKAAFGRLVERYRDKILFLCYDMLGDWDSAKDAAQSAFIKSYEKLPSFREEAQFSTWLYRIAVNICMDRHRKQKRYPTDSLDSHVSDIDASTAREGAFHTPLSQQGMEAGELRSKLEAAIRHLSVNQRTAVILRYFQERSTREIAEIMNCSENTVRIHLFRAMRRLRDRLGNTIT